jgi:dienelactone hydrolase
VSEPRFERHQLGDALQKAAELQEGRADPGAADRLGLRGIQEMSGVSERASAGSRERETSIFRAFVRSIARALRKLGVAIVFVALAQPVAAQQQPVGDDAFRILRQLFDYDATLPLNARTVQRFDTTSFYREKFVINGWQGTRIPGLIAIPKAGGSRYPVVLLIDGIGGWKERWWQQTSWNRGRVLIDSLVASGFAVVMIDAPASGERIYENDFESAETFIRKPAQLQSLAIQNTIEHRRVLDYVVTRTDVDTARIGVLGLSLGGMTAFYLGTVETRLKAAVTGLTPLWRGGDVTSAANYAPHVRMPMLMLMGRQDSYYTAQHVDDVYRSLGSKSKHLIWYDVGHRLPEDYASAAADWFRRHLSATGDR